MNKLTVTDGAVDFNSVCRQLAEAERAAVNYARRVFLDARCDEKDKAAAIGEAQGLRNARIFLGCPTIGAIDIEQYATTGKAGSV